MEPILTEKDAQILDKILEKVEDGQFLELDNVIPHQDCKYYFDIFTRYPDIVKPSTCKPNRYQLTTTNNTKIFKNNGGFVEKYNKQKEEIEKQKKIEDLQLSNQLLENQQLTFTVEKQRKLYMLTILGFIISLVSIGIAIIALIKSK